VICAISFIGWMFLMILFPALAVLQLLSAGIRTFSEFKKTDWHRRTFRLYWIMVGVWTLINSAIWALDSFDSTILSQMLLSAPIAIWYYVKISQEKAEVRRITETAENARLAAMVK
jgi:hypothetical protein